MLRPLLLPFLALATTLAAVSIVACSDSTTDNASGNDGGGGGGGGSDAGAGAADGATSPEGGAGAKLDGATQVNDILGSGDKAYFTGLEGGGEGAIFSASTTAAGATVLCKAGANKTLVAIAIDGTTLYAIRRDSGTGEAAIVKTTTSATGAACDEVGKITAGSLTELVKVGDALVYLGSEKVMKLPIAGGTESELLTTAGTGFTGDFSAAGTTGFAVDTSTNTTPGARLARFKQDGASETFATFNSPQQSVHEIVGGKVVWAVAGANAGDFVFKAADTGATLPVTEEMRGTRSLGIGAVLTFCRPDAANPTELAVAAASGNDITYHLVVSTPERTSPITSVEAAVAPPPCALTAGALWAIDPNDQKVFWSSR